MTQRVVQIAIEALRLLHPKILQTNISKDNCNASLCLIVFPRPNGIKKGHFRFVDDSSQPANTVWCKSIGKVKSRKRFI